MPGSPCIGSPSVRSRAAENPKSSSSASGFPPLTSSTRSARSARTSLAKLRDHLLDLSLLIGREQLHHLRGDVRLGHGHLRFRRSDRGRELADLIVGLRVDLSGDQRPSGVADRLHQRLNLGLVRLGDALDLRRLRVRQTKPLGGVSQQHLERTEARSSRCEMSAGAHRDQFDLMVLDLMIPGLDGLSLCSAVRDGRTNSDVPILLLTARRDESDKVIGLESGADEYLTKPFGVLELVARARALLRRPRAVAAAASNGDELGPPVTVHGVDIDPARRRVRIAGREIELTDQEFRLLYLLATHAGIVFSREALL